MKAEQTKGYLMIFIAGTLWSTIGVFIKILQGLGAESGTIAFLRIATGVIPLGLVLLFMGGTRLFRIDKKGLAVCMAIGFLSQALFNIAYAEAVVHVGMATGAVLLYTSPIFVSIMSVIFFKEKMTLLKVSAIAINIAGCVLTVTGGNFSAVQFSVYGVGMGVLAGFCYSLMTILGTVTSSYNPLTIMFYGFAFGALALSIFSEPWGNLSEAASPALLLAGLLYALIPTIGAYFFYMKGLAHHLETSKVPVVASVETVFAALIGILAFEESMNVVKFIGVVLVVVSIAMRSGLFAAEEKAV